MSQLGNIWQKDATNIYRYNIRIRVHVQSYFTALWCAPFGLLFLILLSKLAGPTIANKTKFQADSEFQGPKFVVYGCQTSVGLIPPNDLKVSKKLDRQMSWKHEFALPNKRFSPPPLSLPLLKLHFRSHFNSIFGQKLRRLVFELFATLFSSHKRLGRHIC
jgi:hypothetical protein